jgi:SAM-dependent methyltransferase
MKKLNIIPTSSQSLRETRYYYEARPILTSRVGTNADLLPDIFTLYVRNGCVVADVTYGNGVFWSEMNEADYKLLKSDLALNGVDFTKLPYEDASVDVVLFDPPFMHGSAGESTIKESINKCYKNNNAGHESVVRLYAAGILEAARVLKKGGILLVKCQDETESAKQRLTHIEIIEFLEASGFLIRDLFVLVQPTTPAMREQYQKSARKNHSYAIVAQFRR